MSVLVAMLMLLIFFIWWFSDGRVMRQHQRKCKEFRAWLRDVVPSDFDDDRRSRQ